MPLQAIFSWPLLQPSSLFRTRNLVFHFKTFCCRSPLIFQLFFFILPPAVVSYMEKTMCVVFVFFNFHKYLHKPIFWCLHITCKLLPVISPSWKHAWKHVTLLLSLSVSFYLDGMKLWGLLFSFIVSIIISLPKLHAKFWNCWNQDFPP